MHTIPVGPKRDFVRIRTSMRHHVLGALAVLAVAGEARAQFANRSVGFQAGYLNLENVAQGALTFGIPIGLDGSLYIENGFEVVGGAGIMVVHEEPSSSNILALDGPSVGIRYLFSQESIRPYVGLDLSYLHLFGSLEPITDFVGLAPNAGLDYFVTDSVSLGLRFRFNLYVSLNAFWYAPAVNLAVNTYF
jgi:outer membrane protein